MTEQIRVDEHTWRMEDDFVRFFLLEGENKAAMIDSGVNSADALEIAKELTDKEIILINTHGDGDHTSATGSFKEIYMGKEDYVNQKMADRFPDTALHEVHDGDIIDLGNRVLEIVSIPGHTAGSIAILDVTNRTLYAGDSVQNGQIYMFGGHRAPEMFDESLKKLIDMSDRYDTIVASHGMPTLPADYTAKVLEDWKKVLNNEASRSDELLYGTMVKTYKLDNCGFYMKNNRGK